jgi:potassium-dependent mechanosensitive channel
MRSAAVPFFFPVGSLVTLAQYRHSLVSTLLAICISLSHPGLSADELQLAVWVAPATSTDALNVSSDADPQEVIAAGGVQEASDSAVEAKLPEAGTNANGELTVEALQARRDEVDRRTDLEEALKVQLLKHYERAVAFENQRTDTLRQYSQLKKERDSAPTLIAELKAELELPAASGELEYPDAASVAELDRMRLLDQEKLEEARKSMEAWESRAKLRAERRPQLPALIEATRKQLEELRKGLENAVHADAENPHLSTALRAEQQTQIQLLSAQLDLYRIEQLRYEALQEMFPLQRDLLTRNRNALERKAERWKEVLSKARLKESERQRREARKQLESTHPALRDIAERNSQLTQLRQEHLQLRGSWKTQQAKVNELLDATRQKFEDVQERVDRVGLTTAIGLTLRNQKGQLPDARVYARKGREAEQEFIRLQTEQLQLDDERRSLDDVEARTAQIVKTIDAREVPDHELHKMTYDLLIIQREYLDTLLADFDSSLTMLVDLDFSCRQLSSTVREYDSYIDERVLWIRSVPPVRLDIVQKAANSIFGFFSHHQWLPLIQFLTLDIQKNWIWYLGTALGVLGLLRLNHYYPGGLSRGRPPSISQLESGIKVVFAAVGTVVLLAATWPAVIALIGWRFLQSNSSLGEALGAGFHFSAALLWILVCFLKICSRNGVAHTFWQWPESGTQGLRSCLWLYIVLGVPLGWIVVVSQQLDEGASTESIGRLALIVFCSLLSLRLGSLLRPSGPVVSSWIRTTSNPLFYKFRWTWYPLVILSPLVIVCLAILGYQYTAEQLTIRLEWTLALLVGLAIANAMLKQWLMAARRRLAIKQARDRRDAERQAAQLNNPGSPIPVVEPDQLDLSLLNRQVTRMVQVASMGLFLGGCWLIWDQVFPALQVFGRVEVWSSVVTTSELVQTAGGTEVREISRVQPITLGNLMMALAVLVACIMASRNLPGLIELSVLQKLPLDSGVRHAIKILSGYAFLTVGVVLISNMIGMKWNSVQWLVAALTVGLGFGLQEIFANFVSGLIILFERPVRIGDIVTIDGVSGTVSKIKTRATTITDWDRKEFIVPNKEFVTGRLLNWTLSDQTTRVLINVPVASGADVRLALNLMLQSAEEHPLVLDDPAPIATFESFGDGTLNLALRSYLPNLDYRLQVITELHLDINSRFRKAGVDVSFPQRGLHIHGSAPEVLVPSTDANELTNEDDSIPLEIGHENVARDNSRQKTRGAA